MKMCINCNLSERIDGKNETVGCNFDMSLHNAEQKGCCNWVPLYSAEPFEKILDALKNKSYERFGNDGMGGELVVNIDDAVEIVKQVAKDYKNGWIPVEQQLPETDDYILLSFENFTVADIGRYEVDKDGNGAFYPGDEDKSYVSFGLFVNAWKPLPKPYREDESNDSDKA